MRFITVWQGFTIMITFCLLGGLLALAGGTLIDLVMPEFSDWITSGDINTEWADATTGPHHIIINVYYALMYGIPVLGIVIFVMSLVFKQYYDTSSYYYSRY